MSQYIDFDYLTRRYAQLSKIGGADEATIFIEAASAEIDAALVTRYSIPFSPAPALIKSLTADLVYAKVAVEKDKARDKIRKEVYEILMKLSDGSMNLVTDSGTIVATQATSAVWTENGSNMPTFNVDSELDWKTDQSLLDDLENRRG